MQELKTSMKQMVESMKTGDMYPLCPQLKKKNDELEEMLHDCELKESKLDESEQSCRKRINALEDKIESAKNRGHDKKDRLIDALNENKMLKGKIAVYEERMNDLVAKLKDAERKLIAVNEEQRKTKEGHTQNADTVQEDVQSKLSVLNEKSKDAHEGNMFDDDRSSRNPSNSGAERVEQINNIRKAIFDIWLLLIGVILCIVICRMRSEQDHKGVGHDSSDKDEVGKKGSKTVQADEEADEMKGLQNERKSVVEKYGNMKVDTETSEAKQDDEQLEQQAKSVDKNDEDPAMLLNSMSQGAPVEYMKHSILQTDEDSPGSSCVRESKIAGEFEFKDGVEAEGRCKAVGSHSEQINQGENEDVIRGDDCTDPAVENICGEIGTDDTVEDPLGEGNMKVGEELDQVAQNDEDICLQHDETMTRDSEDGSDEDEQDDEWELIEPPTQLESENFHMPH
eukprot:767263-Hanusia_phi.AAC.4